MLSAGRRRRSAGLFGGDNFCSGENKFEKAAAAATPKRIIWNLTAI
jgi:hypothetical protein